MESRPPSHPCHPLRELGLEQRRVFCIWKTREEGTKSTPPPHRPPALPGLCLCLCSVLARGNRGGNEPPRIDLWELGAYKLKLGTWYWGTEAFTPECRGAESREPTTLRHRVPPVLYCIQSPPTRTKIRLCTQSGGRKRNGRAVVACLSTCETEMLSHVAHLLRVLAHTEMRLACLQDDLLSTGASPFRGSTMELLCGGPAR